MSDLMCFNSDDHEIRSIVKDGVHHFVIKDILDAIESSTTVTKARESLVEQLGEELVTNQPLKTNSGTQLFACTTEAGLTYIVAQSRTEAGKRLNVKIHKEILPSIRKTGSYSISSNDDKLDWLVAQVATLTANKSELEKLGKAVAADYPGNAKLIKYVEDGGITEYELELLDAKYRTCKAITVKELFELLRPDYFLKLHSGCVYNRVKLHLRSHYERQSELFLPVVKNRIVLQKKHAIYAIWWADSDAISNGLTVNHVDPIKFNDLKEEFKDAPTSQQLEIDFDKD